MAELVVGCPVLDRAWALPAWFAHLDEALARAGFAEVAFAFVGDPAVDAATWEAIAVGAAGRPVRAVVVPEMGLPDPALAHRWTAERFRRMVELRNALLGAVRDMAPAWFLSVDSDILLHPDALVEMSRCASGYDAVGAKTYLTAAGVNEISYASLVGGSLSRSEFHGAAAVDVIMAIKLMSPAAYGVDYVWHHSGEDVGWSIAARARRLRLGFTGRVGSKHVRSPEGLDAVDARVGY